MNNQTLKRILITGLKAELARVNAELFIHRDRKGPIAKRGHLIRYQCELRRQLSNLIH